MTWNYRVVRRCKEDECFFEVHEAYYNAKGEVEAITENAIALGSETAAGLPRALVQYIEALLQPVLDYDTMKVVEPAPAK